MKIRRKKHIKINRKRAVLTLHSIGLSPNTFVGVCVPMKSPVSIISAIGIAVLEFRTMMRWAETDRQMDIHFVA